MTRFRSAAVVIGVVAAGSTVGQDDLPTAGDARIVPEHVLAQQRAGFIGRDGLRIEIGLEQVTSINGEIAYRSVLRALGPLDTPSAPEAFGALAVIRDGGIDVQAIEAHSDAWVNVIQNALDGQSIEHQVIMDLKLSRIPALRSDVDRALERALLDATSF